MEQKRINYWKLIGLFLIGSYIFICIFNLPTGNENWHLINNVDLIFHEAGHTIVPSFIFGEFVHVLSGSLFQILIPLLLALYFYIQRDFFSGSILILWVAESLAYVSVYIADAVTMQLPLLGGDNVMHDWNYLLTSSGLLAHTHLITQIVYGGAWVVFAGGVLVALRATLKADVE